MFQSFSQDPSFKVEHGTSACVWHFVSRKCCEWARSWRKFMWRGNCFALAKALEWSFERAWKKLSPFFMNTCLAFYSLSEKWEYLSIWKHRLNNLSFSNCFLTSSVFLTLICCKVSLSYLIHFGRLNYKRLCGFNKNWKN